MDISGKICVDGAQRIIEKLSGGIFLSFSGIDSYSLNLYQEIRYNLECVPNGK